MRSRRVRVRTSRGFISATLLAACALGGTALDAQQASEGPIEAGDDRAANPAAAVAPGAANTVSFPRAFFAQFRPVSALDMINRIPGFAFNGGDGDVRGLAGSAGNVLIDGQRPVTKSLGLGDLIRRIQVNTVIRIDLIRGGAPGVDMQGQTLVANIIRDPKGFASATGEFQTKFYHNRGPARNPRVEGSWARGDWTLSGALAARSEREQGNAGDGPIERIDVAGMGAGSAFGRFTNARGHDAQSGNATVEWRHDAHLARLNLSGSRDDVKRRERVRITPRDGVERRELVAADELETAGEASLDYENALSRTLTARVMLLQRLEGEDNSSSSSGRGVPQTSIDGNLEGETIARIAATIVPNAKLTIDTSAEGSYNFLDAETELIRNGVPEVLPSANLRVTEKRANLAASARWQAAAWGSVEGAMGYETSVIAQSGDVRQRKTLAYWKPRAVVTIDPAANWQVRLRAERQVGQLDFGDFATVVSLEPGAINAGNPNLVPETTRQIEAAVERRFWGNGVVTLTASHSWISDALDLVPIANRFDAPGNIGDGWREEARLSITLPTDRLGIKGGQVRLNGTLRQSQVTDPVTGLRRRRSGERPFSGDLVVTKDLPGLRSQIGIEVFTGFNETYYRLFERRNERSTSEPLTRLYWDYVPSARTAFRFQLENWNSRMRSRERILYQGVRSLGVVGSREYRSATLDPFIMIRARRQF